MISMGCYICSFIYNSLATAVGQSHGRAERYGRLICLPRILDGRGFVRGPHQERGLRYCLGLFIEIHHFLRPGEHNVVRQIAILSA